VDVLASRTRQITEGSILLALLRIAGPVVVSTTLQASYQLVNTFWVGRLGAAAVAAVAVSAPITFLLVVLGGGLSVAGSIFVAQYSGARQHRMVSHVAAQTILMVVLVSVGLSIVGSLAAGMVLRATGIAPDVLALGCEYVRITFLGLVFSYGFMMFQAILQGAGEVRFPLRIIAITLLLNAVLDPLLIFGWGPIPGYGVRGAAFATVSSQAAAAILGLRPLFTGRFGIHVRRQDFRPDPVFIKRALAVAIPSSVEQSTRTLASVILTMLAAKFGTESLAAYGVGMRVISFFLIPSIAFSTATATVVGQNIGAGKMERAAHAARLAGWAAFGGLTALGLLFWPFAAAVARLLVPGDPQVIGLSAGFLHVLAPVFGIIGAQLALAGAFRGAGHTMTAMVLSLTLQWVVQLPAAWWLATQTPLGFAGVWWSFPIANALALGVTVLCMRRLEWDRRRLTEEIPALVVTETQWRKSQEAPMGDVGL
jgi:putative MATE family efflux protein